MFLWCSYYLTFVYIIYYVSKCMVEVLTEEEKNKILESYMVIPEGTSITQLFSDGTMYVVRNGSVEEVTEEGSQLHKFISDGNLALYLEGNPDTSDNNPNNATAKFGITRPLGHFEPHVHGSKHKVTTLDYGGGILLADNRGDIVNIDLLPRAMIDIEGGVPHSFYNRSHKHLSTLIVNSGLGINNENYAIKRDEALTRGDVELAETLARMEDKITDEIKKLSEAEKLGLTLLLTAEKIKSL